MRPAPGLRGGMQLQTWDTCMSLIVYGDDVSRAQKTFEDWCHASERGENPVQTEIKKIVGAQLVPEFLTEAGGQQLDTLKSLRPNLPVFSFGVYEESDWIFHSITGVNAGYYLRRRPPLD